MAEPKRTELEKLIDKTSLTRQQIVDEQNRRPVLSYGVFALDFAGGAICPYEGNGGVRARDMVEIMAKNGSGKTAIMYAAMAATQRRWPEGQNIVAYCPEVPDEEQFMRMAMQGVDPDRVIWIGLETTGNRALQNALELVKYPEIKEAFIDSIAAIPVAANADKTLEENAGVAALANLYNRFSADFVGATKFAPLVQLNHFKDYVAASGRPGAGAPLPTVIDPSTAGGKTKDFLGKARIKLDANQDYEKDNKMEFKWGESNAATYIEGLKIKFKYVRNKYAPPLREGWIKYDFTTFKFNNAEQTLRIASTFSYKDGALWKSKLSLPVIQAGAYWTIGDHKVQGADNAFAWLDDNPEIMLQLQKEIMPYHKDFFLNNVSFDEDDIDK